MRSIFHSVLIAPIFIFASLNNPNEIAKKSKNCIQKMEAPPLVECTPTPDALPCYCQMFDSIRSLNKNDFFLDVEYLFWKTKIGGTDFAVKNVPNLSGNLMPFGQTGDIVQGTFDWQSGVRVGAGYTFSSDFWEVEAQYTYIAPSGTKSLHPDPEGASPTFVWPTINVVTNNDVMVARAKMAMSYNLLDLVLAKRLQISNRMIVRLLAGATGAWISEKFNIFYSGFPVQQGGPFIGIPGAFTKIKNKWSFQGGGIKAGTAIDWYLGAGFSLLSNFKMALLYGNYHASSDLYGAFIATPSVVADRWDARLHDARLASMIQFGFGPAWSKNFCNWSASLFLTYDLNFWFNLAETLYSTTSMDTANARMSHYRTSDWGMQGISTGFQVSY